MKHKIFTPLLILLSLKSTISFCQDPVSCDLPFVEADWTCVGPLEEVNNNNIGRVVAIWVSPFNPDYILVGTRSSGIWRTTNDGATWTNLTSYQLPACGIKDIAVYDNGTETTTDDIIYATTQFYGNDINVYGVGLIYSEDNGITWTQDFSMDTDYDLAAQPFVRTGAYVGSNNLYFVPGESYFLLTNGNNILKKEIFTHDWELFNAFTSFSISELDIKPDNNEFVIGSPNFGDISSFVYTYDNGANWNTITCPTPADLPLSGIYNIQVLASTSIPENNHFYTLFKYLITGDNDDDPDTDDNTIVEYWFSSYVIVLNSIYLEWTKKANNLGTNNYESLILNVYADYTDFAFVGRGQNTLFKADLTTPTTISFFKASAYNGANSHTDIRDMDYYFNSTSEENYIYIAQDGGLSKTALKESIVSGATGDNDSKWVSLNGYGLTITEFNGIGGTEKVGRKLFISAPDGNSYTFIDNLQINYPNDLDYARSKISNANPDLGLMNGNSGFFDAATTKRFIIDDTPSSLSSVTFPRSGGITDDEIEDEGLNWGYRPFKFDAENRFWMGTMDMFYYNDVEGEPSDYLPASDVSAFMFPEPATEFQMKNPINSFDVRKDESTGNSYVYFSTIDPKSIDDPNKLMLVALNSSNEIIDRNNITPYTVLGDYPSRINYSYITDIEIGRGPNEVWVAFGGSKTTYDNNWLAANDPAKKGEVYFSDDYGDTWIATGFAGLPNYPIHCLEYIKGTNNVLLAGTDVGVYIYHDVPGGAYWECFNTNMPYCSVSDIYINYCTNTIFISTFGYGVWECPLPDFETESPYHYKPIIFEEDYLWSSTKDAYTDIIIKPGATLTVQNCEIRMPKDGKIIVENGGKLVLDGATITNYCDFWDGIEVWGIGNLEAHPTRTQVVTGLYPVDADDHGLVYIINNSLIQNAKTGITTLNSNNPTNQDHYGGVIIAKESVFKNNIISVDIKPFDNPDVAVYDNISLFEECTFSRDNQMPVETDNLSDVYLNDVDGVEFFKCQFINTFTNCESANNNPEGITGTNATFIVKGELCNSEPPSCVVIRGSFEGYYRAVHAANTLLCTNPIVVNGIDFLNNERGVLLSNNAAAEVTKCNFEIPDFTNRTTYGLYLESSFNYHIEGNLFKPYGSLTSSSHYCSGIFVENNSNKATEIYRNTFEDIEIGIRSQGNNSKLQLKCNEFRNSGATNLFNYNIIVTSGVLGNQGICNASITEPAGNKFNSGYALGYPQSEFRIVPSGVNINYRHHTEPEYIPDYYTSSQINLQDCGISGESDCPSTLTEELEVEERTVNPALLLIEEADEIQLTIEGEKAKIDGGNTDDLINEINTSVSPSTLINEINAISPYLSNEAMGIILKAEPIGTSDVLTILSENYPIADSLQTSIETSNYEIPSPVVEFLTENIINDTLITSAYNDLLATINVLSADREQLLIDAAYIYFNNQPLDSSINYLQNYDEDWAKQLLIEFSTNNGEFESAENLLESYNTIDDPNYVQFYNLIVDIAKTNRSIYGITGTEESILRQIATKDYPSGVAAQNILDAVFQEKYPEVIDEIPELMMRLVDFDINTTNQGFKIYPNPADNILYIEILNWDVNTNYWANIYDMKGIKVATYDLRNDYKLSWIETEKILTGIYLIEVYSGNQILGTQKIIFE